MPGARPVGRFPAEQRIRRRSEFSAATAHGRRVVTQHFVLLIHARQVTPPLRGVSKKYSAATPPRSPLCGSLDPPRLGIIASRKIGHAVRRNRAKRLVREAFRATRDLWLPGIDLVVIVRTPLMRMKLDDVVTEWREESAGIVRRSRQAQTDAQHRAEAPQS